MKRELDELTEKIIGAAIRVHKVLGPGLLESAYEQCLIYELRLMGLHVESQRAVPVVYRDIKLDCGYRLDIVVEQKAIIEIKAVEKVLPVHKAQLLSYLRLTSLSVGLLINFHVPLLVDGIARVVNDYPDTL